MSAALTGSDDEIREALVQLLTNLDPDAEYELRHEEFIAEMPQSGERIRGRDAMRELQRAFPPETAPTFQVRRILGGGDTWTVEAVGGRGATLYAATVSLRTRTSALPAVPGQPTAVLGASAADHPPGTLAVIPHGCGRRSRRAFRYAGTRMAGRLISRFRSRSWPLHPRSDVRVPASRRTYRRALGDPGRPRHDRAAWEPDVQQLGGTRAGDHLAGWV
jgi:hypothetical protein